MLRSVWAAPEDGVLEDVNVKYAVCPSIVSDTTWPFQVARTKENAQSCITGDILGQAIPV